MSEVDKEERKMCFYIDCNQEVRKGFDCCDYCLNGGVFGSGETYEQYQIIEQDFIDFIKVVPINDEAHLKVHSPVLRDIIIRACIQIEIFFKEWGKQICSKNKENSLWEEYNKTKKNGNKGERNWSIGSYYYFKEAGFINEREIMYVLPMDMGVEPFDSWKNIKNPPTWWNVYNSIKHGGLSAKKDANLDTALNALAALFILHCRNKHSRDFLKKHTSDTITHSAQHVTLTNNKISSPIGSARYLFEDPIALLKKSELPKKQIVFRDSGGFSSF